MARTPEQKAADLVLSDAINAAVEAYGYREADMANTNYVVIVEQIGWNDEGDSRTGIVRLQKDGDLPWTTIIGLLRAATLVTEYAYVTDGSSE